MFKLIIEDYLGLNIKKVKVPAESGKKKREELKIAK
jgi:hypothetical protein